MGISHLLFTILCIPFSIVLSVYSTLGTYWYTSYTRTQRTHRVTLLIMIVITIAVIIAGFVIPTDPYRYRAITLLLLPIALLTSITFLWVSRKSSKPFLFTPIISALLILASVIIEIGSLIIIL